MTGIMAQGAARAKGLERAIVAIYVLTASLSLWGAAALADNQPPGAPLAPALSLLDDSAESETLELAQAAATPAPEGAPAQPAPAEAAPPPAAWADTLTVGGHLEAGITGNPDSPANTRNFGRLFDDHANVPVLNQLWGYIQRPLDPKATGWDFGFNVEALFGTDARFLHLYDQLNHAIRSDYQIALYQAYAIVHVPLDTISTDVQVGVYGSPLGYEQADPTANSGYSFYSHSYISNFGVPSQHTGFLTTTHATDSLDVVFGLDTGANAWLGSSGGGLNNDTWLHGTGGFVAKPSDSLTLTALTHIGPESPKRTLGPLADSALTYFNDAFLTWQATKELAFASEVDYVHNNAVRASAYGASGYVSYAFYDWLSAGARGEIFRDNNGAFVASFKNPFDFINSERGLPTSPGGVAGGGRTTYGELTLGVNIKPLTAAKITPPKPLVDLLIRPEIRVDESLNGTKPFVTGTQGHQVTLAADFVLPFAF